MTLSSCIILELGFGVSTKNSITSAVFKTFTQVTLDKVFKSFVTFLIGKKEIDKKSPTKVILLSKMKKDMQRILKF